MNDSDDLEKAPMLRRSGERMQLGSAIQSNDEEEDYASSHSRPRYFRRKSVKIFLAKPLLFFYAMIVFVVLCVCALWATDKTRPWRRKIAYWNPFDDSGIVKMKDLNPELYTSGNRTARFRDALLQDQKYITAFLTAGWTNDVMASIHIIQLALLSNRIPILPPFPPSHTGPKSGLILFSEIFDLPAFSESLQIPILEWHDIKNTTNLHPEEQYVELYGDSWNAYYGGEPEELGCWSLWMTQRARGASAREGRLPEAFNLDVSWTPVPWGHQVPRSDSLDYNTDAAASLASTPGRLRGIEDSTHYLERLDIQMKNITESTKEGDPPSEIPTKNRSGKQVEPEDHLVCYDYLYFMATYAEFEWWQEWTPAWDNIGQYLHWSPHVRSLAISLLQDALNVTPPSPTSTSGNLTSPAPLPTYIAVHIRRADFDGWCGDVPRSECLAPLSAYETRVKEVVAELRSQNPSEFPLTRDIPVLVMTDEPKVSPDYREPGTSEAWWNAVEELGWVHVDHDLNETAEKYGVWYPAVLDATMLSLASGFVGTDRSTYSLLAKKRVQTWQNGPTRFVKWGSIGADDH